MTDTPTYDDGAWVPDHIAAESTARVYEVPPLPLDDSLLYVIRVRGRGVSMRRHDLESIVAQAAELGVRA